MKRILAFILVILCALSVFVGCAPHEEEQTEETKQETTAESMEHFVGAWTFAEAPDSGEYVIFTDNNRVYYSVGCYKYYGSYAVEKVDLGESSVDEDGDRYYYSLRSDFALLSQEGEDAKAVFNESYDRMTVKMTETTMELIKVDMPTVNLEPEKITHASADELDITELYIDEKLIGTWTYEISSFEGYNEYYLFNTDGTCVYRTDYIEDIGYGLEIEFKYTAAKGRVLFTQISYDGTKDDIDFQYKFEDGKLVLFSSDFEFAYERVA